MSPEQLITWSEALKAAGPYAVIIALLIGMHFLARLAFNLYNDYKELQQHRVNDLVKIINETNAANTDLAVATTKLAERIEEVRRGRSSSVRRTEREGS